MPLPLQAKLLRVIQEKEYERVGAVETRKADVRIIAATSVDLAEAVKVGGFGKISSIA
jgi:transcriptional regulator with PAS, ATPase and Fis domain